MSLGMVSNSLIGLPIYVDVKVMDETDKRTFPASRHRSARIYKKLFQKHGGAFVKVPAIWAGPNALYVHPVMYDNLREMAMFELSNE